MSAMTKQDFNEFIRWKIMSRGSNTSHHYTEQWLYIDPARTHRETILKFENLESDLRALMTKYQLRNILEQLNQNFQHKNTGRKKVFSKNDFDIETLALIRQVYYKDFEWFGYDIYDPSIKNLPATLPLLKKVNDMGKDSKGE